MINIPPINVNNNNLSFENAFKAFQQRQSLGGLMESAKAGFEKVKTDDAKSKQAGLEQDLLRAQTNKANAEAGAEGGGFLIDAIPSLPDPERERLRAAFPTGVVPKGYANFVTAAVTQGGQGARQEDSQLFNTNKITTERKQALRDNAVKIVTNTATTKFLRGPAREAAIQAQYLDLIKLELNPPTLQTPTPPAQTFSSGNTVIEE